MPLTIILSFYRVFFCCLNKFHFTEGKKPDTLELLSAVGDTTVRDKEKFREQIGNGKITHFELLWLLTLDPLLE